MEPRTTIPLDILASIVDLLATGDDSDVISLQVLSQVCKCMVPLCRRHLFSALQFLGAGKSDSNRFSNLLCRNPDIARYVKSFKYLLITPIRDHEQGIFKVLKERSSSLRSIELLSHKTGWSEFPETIQSSLVSLIQLPTITHLKIRFFSKFPATALSLCGHLIDLHLQELEMIPPEVDHVITRDKIPKPVSLYAKQKSCGALAALMQSAGGPIVDFSCLRKVSAEVEYPGDVYYLSELLKTTRQLESLYIMIDWPVGLVGLGASLLANAHRTLRSATFQITVVGDDYDPLCGLSHELRMIAGNNVLEELELEVMVMTDLPCRTESEDWSTFDVVLAESGAFPMLRRVSAMIGWHSFGRHEDDAEDVYDSLTEERFPRLLESTAVKFKFSAEHTYI